MSFGTLSEPYLGGIYDSKGTLIAGTTDDNDGRCLGNSRGNSRGHFMPSAAGTYYVAAGVSRLVVGTYTLSVTEIPDDFAADTATTGTVEVGSSATGEIEHRDDTDWFAVTLEANTTYRIDLKGRYTHGTLSDPYLRGIHDSGGTLIAGTTNDDHGTTPNSRVRFTPSAAGTYYVVAGAYQDTYQDRTGTYTLSVNECTACS